MHASLVCVYYREQGIGRETMRALIPYFRTPDISSTDHDLQRIFQGIWSVWSSLWCRVEATLQLSEPAWARTYHGITSHNGRLGSIWSVHDLSVDYLSVDDLYVDDSSVDDLSVGDVSVDDISVHDISVDELSVHDLSVDDMSVQDLLRGTTVIRTHHTQKPAYSGSFTMAKHIYYLVSTTISSAVIVTDDTSDVCRHILSCFGSEKKIQGCRGISFSMTTTDCNSSHTAYCQEYLTETQGG